MVHYLDDDLLVPEVMTIRFTGETTDDEGERLWIFQPSGPAFEDSEALPLGLPESQLCQVLDFSDLLAKLGELRGFHPPLVTPGTKLRPEDVLKVFPVVSRLEQFLVGAEPHLHINIRYTDDGIFLDRTADAVELHAFTHPLRAPLEDKELVAVLNRRGIAAQTDYLADRGRTRVLHYELRRDVQLIAEICAEIFAITYGITDVDDLVFKLRSDWSKVDEE